MRFDDWFEVAKVRARKNNETVSIGTTSYKKDAILDLLKNDFEDCYNTANDEISSLESENESLRSHLEDFQGLYESLSDQINNFDYTPDENEE